MLQHRRWLRIAALAASLPLLSCNEGTRDITPWSQLLPSEAGQSVVAMALDAQGEPAVAGALIDGFDDSFTHPDGSGQGVFLSMLSTTGKGIWGGVTREHVAQARGVAVAPNGDVLLLGTFTSTITLGGRTLTAQNTAVSPDTTFLARFDPRGALIWSQSIEDVFGHPAHGVTLATNARGDAIFGGYFPATYPEGDSNAQKGFVAAFDADGNHRWTRVFGNLNPQIAAVAVDATGSIYVAGNDLGNPDSSSLEHPFLPPSAFVAKLSSEGAPVFTTLLKNTTTTDAPYISSLTVSSSGAVAFSGSFSDDIAFGPLAFAVLGGAEAFIAELSAQTGTPRWLTPIKVPFGRAEIVAVAAAPNGRVYATGQYQGDELDADGITLGPTSGKAMFLLELDAAGKTLDGRIFDHAGQLSVGRALAFDPAGALVLAGHFVGQIDLDDQHLSSEGNGSSFVARLELPFASHRRE